MKNIIKWHFEPSFSMFQVIGLALVVLVEDIFLKILLLVLLVVVNVEVQIKLGIFKKKKKSSSHI